MAFTLSFLRIRNILLQNTGPLQHKAGYQRDVVKVRFPRSQKAFIFHAIATGIKLFFIAVAIIAFPFDSILWRFIVGAITGFVISSVVLGLGRVRSKSSYLFSFGMLIKISVWLISLSCLTHFDLMHHNISTSGYIQFYLFCMFFIDSVMEQILKIPKKRLFKPIPKAYKPYSDYFERNWVLYLEIPIWTTIYPVIVWIF
jgi:hypothetical protein